MRNVALDIAMLAMKPAGGTSYMLDGMTPTVAISNRKIMTFAGDCADIRRSSDGTEATIGWDGSDEFDQSAYNTHVGAGQGYYAKRYDQSGNALDFIQRTTSDQPEVVTSPFDASLKSCSFNGSNALYHDYGSAYWDRDTFDFFAVVRKTSTTFSEMIMSMAPSTGTSGLQNNCLYLTSSVLRARLDATNSQIGTAATQNELAFVHYWREGSSDDFRARVIFDGTEYTTPDTAKGSLSAMNVFNIGSFNSIATSGNFTGEIDEFVIFNGANASADERNTIEANMIAYYGITGV